MFVRTKFVFAVNSISRRRLLRDTINEVITRTSGNANFSCSFVPRVCKSISIDTFFDMRELEKHECELRIEEELKHS